MRKVFWMMSIVLLSCTMVQAQDDQYNDNPPQQQQNDDDVYYQDNTYNEDQGDNGGVSYQTFYDQLSPYGTWINYPGRGYVWVPQTDGNFSPYETNGHWVYTDYGWTWASDYDWGWAAFHYGRWFQDPDYGWAWAPGYDWAPAWVTWGEYGGYYCWAPLGWGERVGGYNGNRNWYFVDRNHINDDHIQNHIVGRDVVNHQVGAGGSIHVIDHANTYNKSVFNAGPKAADVQKATGHKIEPVKISNAAQPGKTRVAGGAVSIYRPSVSHNAAVQQKATPQHIGTPQDAHNNGGGNSNAKSINMQSQERPAPASQPTRTEQRSEPTPPRQSVQPQQQSIMRNDQPARQESNPTRPSGGFVPNDRPTQAEPSRSEPMRSEPAPSFRQSAPAPSFHQSAPAPSFHAPSGGGGGGGFHGGGGRH